MAFGGFLRYDTSVDVLIGPFLDEANGKDAETGLTIEDEHVLLSKNGQTLTAKADTNDAVHDANGYYNCPLDGADVDTVGQLTVTAHLSGALPVRFDFQILTQAVFDEMFKTAAAGLQGVIVANNLDHLMKVACGANDVVNNTALAKIVSKDATADWSDFDNTKQSLEGLHAGDIADILVYVAAITPLTAQQARDAMKLAPSGNSPAAGSVDKHLDDIVEDTGTAGVKLAANSVDANALKADAVDEIHDEVVEGTITARQVMRLLLAVLTGKSSGGGTTTLTFRDTGDTKDRLIVTVDANGNRTAVGTRDAT